MRYKNRSHSGATSRWGKAWFYEAIFNEHPSIMLTNFGINDHHTNTNGTDNFLDELDPYGNTIKMDTPVTAEEFANNMFAIFRMAIKNNIQPIYIGGSIGQFYTWILEFITRMANEDWN